MGIKIGLLLFFFALCVLTSGNTHGGAENENDTGNGGENGTGNVGENGNGNGDGNGTGDTTPSKAPDESTTSSSSSIMPFGLLLFATCILILV